MLVLTRKKNESIMVGDNIEVIIAEIRGDKVRLGINAPKDLPVHRREVYQAIKIKETADVTGEGREATAQVAGV